MGNLPMIYMNPLKTIVANLLDFNVFQGILRLIEPAKAMRKYPQTGGSIIFRGAVFV